LARVATARSVNSAQVVCNWLIGRQIIEDEQRGRRRAGYRERTLNLLAERLQREFGGGYSDTNLKGMRTFYLAYPDLIHAPKIRHPLGDHFVPSPQRWIIATDGTGPTFKVAKCDLKEFPTRIRYLQICGRNLRPQSAAQAPNNFRFFALDLRVGLCTESCHL
jgi:hypothetical protein